MRNRAIYDDKSILDGLKNRDSDVIKYIYSEFLNMVRKFILSNNGKERDVEDVFQDAIIILYEKSKDENFSLTSSLKTYVFSICKNLWLQKLNKKMILRDNFDDLVEPVEYENYDLKYKIFQENFLKLKEDCQRVLTLFLEKKSLKEISIIMGYKTDKYAKRRKHMCKEKLKNLIVNDSRFKNFIDDYES